MLHASVLSNIIDSRLSGKRPIRVNASRNIKTMHEDAFKPQLIRSRSSRVQTTAHPFTKLTCSNHSSPVHEAHVFKPQLTRSRSSRVQTSAHPFTKLTCSNHSSPVHEAHVFKPQLTISTLNLNNHDTLSDQTLLKKFPRVTKNPKSS